MTTTTFTFATFATKFGRAPIKDILVNVRIDNPGIKVEIEYNRKGDGLVVRADREIRITSLSCD